MGKQSGKKAKTSVPSKIASKKSSRSTSATAAVAAKKSIPACWRRPKWQTEFRRRLLGWFARNKRDLPWRRTKDPYAVWVSEIMLQQTQTPTVVRYFERFLTAFPTVQALAQAEQAEVLRLWEGLGYYRRAVQLHQAAQKIVSEFGGQFPQTVKELLQLPGIGRYTAGAILSIAFDQRQPILEANTVRLWARLLAYSEPVGSASAQRLLWYMAETVLPCRQVGRFNQALMELGSRVCLPRQPRCSECPVSRFCLAFQKGFQESLPRQRAKPTTQFSQEMALIVRRNDQVLLRRIPDGERWAGLWEFPRFPLPTELAEQSADAEAPAAKQPWLFPVAEEAVGPLEPSSEQQTGISRVRRDARFETVPKPPRRRKTRVSSDGSARFIPAAIGGFLVQQMHKQVGIVVRPIRPLGTIRYAVTRYRVQMECYEVEYLGQADRQERTDRLEQQSVGTKPKGRRLEAPAADSCQAVEPGGDFQWVRLESLEGYPMSSPARKLARLARASSGDFGKETFCEGRK